MRFALVMLGWCSLLPLAPASGARWLPANDAAVTRSGTWDWNSHRYAAEPALETTEEGAALEFDVEGQALVMCLDTLTPPNNYGPPELGVIEVFVDGMRTMEIRPRSSANEITISRVPALTKRQIKLVHRQDGAGRGARIRGFRLVSEASGDLAFVVSGEKHGALIDCRVILRRDGRVVRDALVRNWLTGECRLAGLPPGDSYDLEVRASGWRSFRTDRIAINTGRETALPPVYLEREHDTGQDEFAFPRFGYAAVRRPGEAFRARFEGHRAEVRGLRLVRRHGAAVISRACAFEEDKAAAFYYHREGNVSIPAGTPPGTYDFEITLADQRGTRTLVSPRSVAVVETFPPNPTFVSWGHLDTWGQYQAEYVGELVTLANLLAADMVLISNEANPAYSAGALYGLEMPFVINFGNHRGPEAGPWFGEPVGAVDFASAFTVINFGLPWDRGTELPEALLRARTGTRIKIINAFEANAPVEEFLDRHGVGLIHYGHGPGPAVARFGRTPTLRVGKSSSESFRVIRYQDGRPATFTYRGHATAPIPFARGTPPPLGITYDKLDDGPQLRTVARHHNDLEETLPDARAEFVLPRGAYRVTGGRIERVIESDDRRFTVVSVRFDLVAKSRGEIVVESTNIPTPK